MARTPEPVRLCARWAARPLPAAPSPRPGPTSTAGCPGRRVDRRFARFTGHFTALGQITGRMLDAIEHDVAGADPNEPSGAVHEHCRPRTSGWAWWRGCTAGTPNKYDQRLDDATGTVLQAAEEVVRSCWTEAFASADRDSPHGPLVYLDTRFDAVATVPSDLRAAADAVVGQWRLCTALVTDAVPVGPGSSVERTRRR